MLDFYRNPEQYAIVRYLDEDPEVAARLHCDSDVRYGLLDVCQILSNVWHIQDLSKHDGLLQCDWGLCYGTLYNELSNLNSLLGNHQIYNARHRDHPATLWAGLYGGNYDWLYRLGMALLAEYTLRFDRIHACTLSLRDLEIMPPALIASSDTWCDAPAVLPPEFVEDNVNESFKNYYRKGKHGVLSYTRRVPPSWLSRAIHINKE